MPTLTHLPMETYLLAGQAAPLKCAICDNECRVSGEHCHRCSAPLSIARLQAETKRPAQIIACIGASGAGKTTYLGMLMDMLMRQAGSFETTLLGAHSISLQQTTTTALASGWYPDKTLRDPEHTCWVHCRVSGGRRRHATEVVFADLAGDVFADELELPGSYPVVRNIFTKCAAIMVLADAQRLQAGEHDDDYISLKLMSLISELQPRNKKWMRRGKRPPHTALIFTKADTTPACARDPFSFAENHASALLHDCQRRFPRINVFGTTVTGASGFKMVGGRQCRVPLRVEPQGIVEPFRWLVEHL